MPTYGGLAAVFIKDELSAKGAVDSTTFTGSKNDAPHSAWTYVSGKVPAKDDLSNVYLYAITDEADDLILYAGLERLDPGGSSHVDIEINQQPISLNADGTFKGEKTHGDILLAMDFENGGALGFVEVYEWMAPANTWQLIASVNDGSGEGCNPANGYPEDTVCAFNNGSPIPNGGWDSFNKNGNLITELSVNAFTEMGLNITELLGETPCFTSVIAKTRSSASLTSDLKDFVIGKFGLCDARISISGGDTVPVGQQVDLSVLLEVKDGTTGFAWGPAVNYQVDGSLENLNGASADFVGTVSTCTTTADGTCSLTVNSSNAGRAVVSATASGIFTELPDFSVTTDGLGENSTPAEVNWTDVGIIISASGGYIDEVGSERPYEFLLP